MKAPLPPHREYPHLIVKGARRNWRRPLVISDEPVGATSALEEDVFIAPGMLDAAGAITERGRQIVLRRLSAMARKSRARPCVVWSDTSCTWIDGEGRRTDGARPPEGDVSDPWSSPLQPMSLEDCQTIRLPAGCDASHLCIQRLGHGLVEISPGERIVLADFDVPHDPALPDPAAVAGLLAGRRLRPPASHRGVKVEGVAGWRLLGPVQPQDGGCILRDPWPDDVRGACVAIAGTDLPKRLTDAAWRVVDPERTGINLVGVLRAA